MINIQDYSHLSAAQLREIRIPRTTIGDYIIDIIRSNGGQASLNEIIVALHARLGRTWKRATVSYYLHRLRKSYRIYSIPGTRGFYMLSPPYGAYGSSSLSWEKPGRSYALGVGEYNSKKGPDSHENIIRFRG